MSTSLCLVCCFYTNGRLSMADQRWWIKWSSDWNLTFSAIFLPDCWLLPNWCLWPSPVEVDVCCWKKTTKTPTNLLQRCFCCLSRGRARGGASLCLGHHSWQFPSVMDFWWRHIWPICDQNKRQQKIRPSARVQRPWWWTNQGFDWTHEWHRVWNRALWCLIRPTLPTYFRGCSDRYMKNTAVLY